MNLTFTTVGLGHDYAPSAVAETPVVHGLLFAGALLLGAFAYRLCRRTAAAVYNAPPR